MTYLVEVGYRLNGFLGGDKLQSAPSQSRSSNTVILPALSEVDGPAPIFIVF